MVVFHRILAALTGLLVASVLVFSAAAFVRPPLGPGSGHPDDPALVTHATTHVAPPAVAVRTASAAPHV